MGPTRLSEHMQESLGDMHRRPEEGKQHLAKRDLLDQSQPSLLSKTEEEEGNDPLLRMPTHPVKTDWGATGHHPVLNESKRGKKAWIDIRS